MKALRIYLGISLLVFIVLDVGRILGFVEYLSIVGLFLVSFLWPFILFYGLVLGVLFAIGMLAAFAGI